MKIPFTKPEITSEDAQAVKEFLLECDGQLTQGKMVGEFEDKFSEYIGRGYCLATSSCMSALHLSYLSLGIGPGDEVICPAMSYVATAHSIELVGAKPIFIDCYRDGNINVHLIDSELQYNRNIKAITLVHYLGNPCSMEYINKITEDYGIYTIEDCALSLGSRADNVHTGLLGTCGAFSFYPTKHLPIGEGGMFVTKDPELYRKARHIATFGKTEGTHADYDIGLLGSNFRMPEISAVMGLSQLKRLDENLEIRKRNLKILKKNINCYRDIISGGTYCALLSCSYYSQEDRNKIRDELMDKGIQTSIYYPHPIPRLKFYRDKYGYSPIRYPKAIKIADTTLVLPIGPHVTEEKMDYMIECLKDII